MCLPYHLRGSCSCKAFYTCCTIYLRMITVVHHGFRLCYQFLLVRFPSVVKLLHLLCICALQFFLDYSTNAIIPSRCYFSQLRQVNHRALKLSCLLCILFACAVVASTATTQRMTTSLRPRKCSLTATSSNHPRDKWTIEYCFMTLIVITGKNEAVRVSLTQTLSN